MTHFAGLALAAKRHGGFLFFADIVEWYNEHYVTVNETTVQKYVPVITQLITGWMDAEGLFTLAQLTRELVPQYNYGMTHKFQDLSDEVNAQLPYRIMAECMSRLTWTEVSKIAGLQELADSKKGLTAKRINV